MLLPWHNAHNTPFGTTPTLTATHPLSVVAPASGRAAWPAPPQPWQRLCSHCPAEEHVGLQGDSNTFNGTCKMKGRVYWSQACSADVRVQEWQGQCLPLTRRCLRLLVALTSTVAGRRSGRRSGWRWPCCGGRGGEAGGDRVAIHLPFRAIAACLKCLDSHLLTLSALAWGCRSASPSRAPAMAARGSIAPVGVLLLMFGEPESSDCSGALQAVPSPPPAGHLATRKPAAPTTEAAIARLLAPLRVCAGLELQQHGAAAWPTGGGGSSARRQAHPAARRLLQNTDCMTVNGTCACIEERGVEFEVSSKHQQAVQAASESMPRGQVASQAEPGQVEGPAFLSRKGTEMP